MSMHSVAAEFGWEFWDLVSDQAKWSQETFGRDAERGPVGPLLHLHKEAVEAKDAWLAYQRAAQGPGVVPTSKDAFYEELADCLLLLLDASRRGGVKPMQLVKAAQAKMEKNKKREWPKPENDRPVEHVRET